MCGTCRNDLVILGPEPLLLELRRRLRAHDSSLDFRGVLPAPPDLAGAELIRWRLRHWGCLTAAPTDGRLVDDNPADGELVYVFSTAARPPVAIGDALARAYPDLTITLISEPLPRRGACRYTWACGLRTFVDFRASYRGPHRCGESRSPRRDALTIGTRRRLPARHPARLLRQRHRPSWLVARDTKHRRCARELELGSASGRRGTAR